MSKQTPAQELTGMFLNAIDMDRAVDALMAAEAGERIEAPAEDDWRCICGNYVGGAGFYPCRERSNGMIERTYIAKSPHWWRLMSTAYFLSTADNVGQVTRSGSSWSWWAYGKGSGTTDTRDEGMDAVEQELGVTVMGDRP